MKALILAAGYGTRLRPLTTYLPKPLMPVVGQPLLGHVVARLKDCHVSGIGINVHHHADQVTAFAGAEMEGMPVQISTEKNIMGSGGGIGGFRQFLKGEDCFLVHNGDILSNIDLEGLIAAHCSRRPMCTMVLQDRPGLNNVALDDENRIIDFRDTLQPAAPAARRAYAGIACFDAALLDAIPEGPCDLIHVLLDCIRAGGHVLQGFVVQDCAWADIGTVKSYFDAHKEILLERAPLVDTLPAAISLGPDSRRADGAQLDGFVSAGPGCLFKAGCRVENAVIWERTVVEEGQIIENAIAGNGWLIHAG
ncbi:MAG: NDP-sugar synthase [Deltaproteobacteria bacterium]|nr:NDP-sugar synthase [Deltaproteobacteria bacterium]